MINKLALSPVVLSTHGWNKMLKSTQLADATVKVVARPNNDTLYQAARLDLCHEPVILDMPAYDSKFASLQTTAYDHYVQVPMSTRLGDFKKPEKALFYSVRTKGYKPGDTIEGIDRYLEMSGDFLNALNRVMPHTNDPARFTRIVGQIASPKVMTLSEYQGKPAQPVSDTPFPAFGKTDADVFGNNPLEVIQFVFNHTTFDPHNEIDQGVLAAYQPLGVEPGKAWDAAKAAKIDGAMFRQVAEEVQQANLAIAGDSARYDLFTTRMFQPKGKIDLDTLVLQSVFGPNGQPAAEAMYPSVTAAHGKPMNELHDYVVRITKDALPPATAFWSLTLYDTKNGFFIPNPQKKYSVGENAGFKLNEEGGIEIHVAAQKPAGVPDENWLPINRGDEGLDIRLRVYAPALEKMKTWKTPHAVQVT